MPDYSDLVNRISTATKDFARIAAAEACDEFNERIRNSHEAAPVAPVKTVLSALRNKRYFDLMESVAAAAIGSGQRHPQVRRQHAQGLIDQGKLTAAMSVLTELIADTAPGGPAANPSEHAEARGLLGRANKQAYVNALSRPSLIDSTVPTTVMDAEYRARVQTYGQYLQRAIDEYSDVYEGDPDRHLWHGINTVACADRAHRDGLDLKRRVDGERIASDILAQLDEIQPRTKVYVWDRATAIEACVALNRQKDALEWLEVYTKAEGADAFELASTLRQLTEVWQLTPGTEPGSSILPVLRAALLRREGGSVELTPRSESVSSLPDEQRALEAIFGDTRFVGLVWYRTGLQRCDAVARIETKLGEGFGSGFLVRGDDMNPALAGKVLLLTNAHVISDDPAEQRGVPPARPPARARVRFEARDSGGVAQTYDIKSLVWTSPRNELDATLLELEPLATCDPPYPLAVGLPIANQDRVYVIGHPKGGGLSLSLQDNRVIDVRAPRLHYRAPTEPGSSGSPVFNQDWELVALHHAGSKTMPSLSGGAMVEANEGISISAIISALKAKFVST